MPNDRASLGTRRLPPALTPLARPIGDIWRATRAASYPLRGIWYFLRNREFYPLFVGRLLPLSVISVLVYTILFTFAFLPQLALLAIFQGRSAWFNAIILVLGEGLVVVQGLFEGFFVDETRVDVFDVGFGRFSLETLTLTSDTGHADQVRANRPRVPPPNPLRRRADRGQDAR